MRNGITLAEYDSVVSGFYDAALSPAHWDVALGRLVSVFGQDRWDIAMLMWERISPPAGRFLGAFGVHEVARAGYLQLFAGQNEWSVSGHDLPVGTVLHSDRLVKRKAFREGAFYREYLTHFDLEVGVLALLDRHGQDHLCLCMPGPDNGPSTRLEEAVKLLIPHIQRAARIARRIGEAELAANTARSVLDCAPSAIMMCDANLRLTYANASAEQMLLQGYCGKKGGRLFIDEGQITQQLRQLVSPAHRSRCFAFMMEPDGLPALGAMAMRIESGDTRLASAAFGEAHLMIVAGRNHKASFANVDHLKDWFGLTPAEARLAATLAEGGSLEDFALTRGISLNASRFLLKGIFSKTDTNRQSQLVARLQSTPLQWHGPESELSSPLH
jgi:DNA-binding CsgD family transcriptional regulator/PAS domain-containing protein